ncbi:Rho termination factor N-terminal domain-containing protein [Streptomyces sp. CC219B]|uniref:Rho termination factor N-terminal domain-containing protein n=1 Tax=Streptomyces sp. CC219B TaxID=3044574 RepID=UPI0024A9C908|nr:Rho termination factor N-terminal domain-containing protein [Streptomyces sp. CC219B]
MRIEFTRTVASPTLSARAGQVLDLPEEEALKRIKAGHAVAVDQPRPRLRDRLPGRRKPESQAEPQDDGKTLEKMTVEQLTAYADELDISLPPDGRKADLVAAIEAELKERA